MQIIKSKQLQHETMQEIQFSSVQYIQPVRNLTQAKSAFALQLPL